MNAPDDPSSDDRTELLGHDQNAPADGSDFGPGSRIGPYTLVEHLGEGGMGQVFLAEQVEPIRRRVALKLIRRQIADDLTLAYFQIERQALARMEHPAIARVYDAGRTEEGFPYFAMEYVEGITLRRWRREASPDLATRLRVFITLVRGVQHAHERGIVHRDLKPDNILVTVVDGQAQPKLIDFGIAIGVDGSGSVSAHRAGTVDYMSPEQFAEQHAAIDARSDVYSLGAVLLDLLDDARILRGGTTTLRPTELHARLRASLKGHVDPDLRAVPLELRHLLARALAPDREHRYASAAALADDVQRFLDGEPLAAVPATRRYAMRKFVQRHRVPVALASAIALAVLAGLVATTWSLQRAEREAARARATADFLSTVLAGVDPDTARELDKTLLRKVLDEAALRAGRELAAQPDVLIDIEGVIARSYTGLEDHERALEHARAAHDLAVARNGESAPSAYATLPSLTTALVNTGHADQALPMLERAIAAGAAAGIDEAKILQLRHNLAITLRDLGRSRDAIVESQPASEGLDRLLGPDAEPSVNARLTLAILLADLDRFDEAVPMIRELIARRSATLGADHPLVLTMRNSLAVFHMQSRKFAEGERELKALLDPVRRQYGDGSRFALMIEGNLGGALRQQGKVEEAGPYYQRTYENYLRLFGPDHMRSMQAAHNYANWLLDAGRIAEALAMQRSALEAMRKQYPDDHPVTAEILTGLGKAQIAAGDLDDAERSLLESMRMKIAVRGPDSSRLPASREALRELYTKLGRTDEVARYAEPAATTP
ncbi:tetratricopeptide repeat protein [Dokdonella sp. MW10]|uniref:tetratricopeptide repeat protein n=1 Tax=Dokdonella sp. MW10 TaxID=2992926 RepID=UPI003F7D4BF0